MDDSHTDHEYKAPEVIDFGRLVDLTAGNNSGDGLDASFPVKTPKDKLRFS